MDEVTPIESAKRRPRARSAGLAKEIEDKAREAYQMQIAGKLPSEIAEHFNTTVDIIDQMLSTRFKQDADRLTGEDRKYLLAQELIALSQLKAAVWPSAMMGDPKSVDSAVRIIMAAHKVAGLEQVDPVVQKNLVLVMGDKEEDYIAALRATNSD
jgi:uncharacterized membrane protein YheB (UPF0754 family)